MNPTASIPGMPPASLPPSTTFQAPPDFMAAPPPPATASPGPGQDMFSPAASMENPGASMGGNGGAQASTGGASPPSQAEMDAQMKQLMALLGGAGGSGMGGPAPGGPQDMPGGLPGMASKGVGGHQQTGSMVARPDGSVAEIGNAAGGSLSRFLNWKAAAGTVALAAIAILGGKWLFRSKPIQETASGLITGGKEKFDHFKNGFGDHLEKLKAAVSGKSADDVKRLKDARTQALNELTTLYESRYHGDTVKTDARQALEASHAKLYDAAEKFDPLTDTLVDPVKKAIDDFGAQVVDAS